MCGRFSQTKSKQEVKKRFNVKKVPDGIEGLFNIAPEQKIPAILNESPDEISLVRWGIIPSWAKEEKTQYSMINARAETLFEKPAYKRLIQKKRCLLIADGFFEWKKMNGRKTPYRIILKSGDLFAFAGLWDLWEKEGEWLSDIPVEKALELLKPYTNDEMKCYEVSLTVNNPKNNSADIISPLE
jgi:putative SOS response-associated peptidase YedK